MHRSRLTAALALPVLLATLLATLLGQAARADDAYRFTVLLGDKPIGHHHFTVTDTDDGFTMQTEARMKVKIAFVTVYSYSHDNRETWRDGCLQTLESTTEDGGDDFSVSATQVTQGLRVESATRDTVTLDGCVMTFSYWKRDWLSNTQLLNSQNGEYLDVAIEATGPATLTIDGEGQPVDGYRIRSGDVVDISVWYHRETDRWLGLRSRRDGRVINYHPADANSVSLPPDGS